MSTRCIVIALAAVALSASVRANVVAGHDYVVIDGTPRLETYGKIEVVEFFSWGCPHCYEFYPMLSRWVATLPKDAAFRRVPVGLGHPEWDALARAYYALQVTGDVDRLDSLIFEDIHKNHVTLDSEQTVTAWVGKHGVNVSHFTDAYRSFGVVTSAGEAEQQAKHYRIPGVPTLEIGGKYVVGSQEHAAMLKTSDELIGMARAENIPTRK